MNQVRNRLSALSLLDRALAAIDDAELQGLLDQLNDEVKPKFDQIVAMAAEEGLDGPAQVRSAGVRGRMNGTLERIALVLTDPCLADCIEQLGDNADNPTQAQLSEVLPGLTERHGIGAVRLMLASTIAGEAAAAAACTHVLKHDEVLALPAVAPAPVVVRPLPSNDTPERAEIKARRKEAKARQQAEAAARRAQAASRRG